jgi:hypothetical protein
MIGWMTVWSLLANNLVKIFMEVFSREIGLKSEALEAPSTLSMRAMRDPLILCRQIFPS